MFKRKTELLNVNKEVGVDCLIVEKDTLVVDESVGT